MHFGSIIPVSNVRSCIRGTTRTLWRLDPPTKTWENLRLFNTMRTSNRDNKSTMSTRTRRSNGRDNAPPCTRRVHSTLRRTLPVGQRSKRRHSRYVRPSCSRGRCPRRHPRHRPMQGHRRGQSSSRKRHSSSNTQCRNANPTKVRRITRNRRSTTYRRIRNPRHTNRRRGRRPSNRLQHANSKGRPIRNPVATTLLHGVRTRNKRPQRRHDRTTCTTMSTSNSLSKYTNRNRRRHNRTKRRKGRRRRRRIKRPRRVRSRTVRPTLPRCKAPTRLAAPLPYAHTQQSRAEPRAPQQEPQPTSQATEGSTEQQHPPHPSP